MENEEDTREDGHHEGKEYATQIPFPSTFEGISPTQPFIPFTAEEDPALQGPPSVTDPKDKTVIDVRDSQ
eukprot:7636164-Pyramimonas_sp.AAC.1